MIEIIISVLLSIAIYIFLEIAFITHCQGDTTPTTMGDFIGVNMMLLFMSGILGTTLTYLGIIFVENPIILMCLLATTLIIVVLGYIKVQIYNKFVKGKHKKPKKRKSKGKK